MDVETRSGNIQMALPNGASFDLTAIAKRGEVENEFGEPLRVVDKGRGRDDGATLTGSVGPGPSLKLTTGRGTITVRKASGSSGRPSAARVSEPGEPPPPPRPPTRGRLQIDRQ
jgi:hypothetical protein